MFTARLKAKLTREFNPIANGIRRVDFSTTASSMLVLFVNFKKLSLSFQ